MKCSKCHKEATKKIQLEDGFLPCCDSYDCNLLLRFELIKPQINNALKSIIVVLALLTINCNVANTIDAPVNKKGIVTSSDKRTNMGYTDIWFSFIQYNGQKYAIILNDNDKKIKYIITHQDVEGHVGVENIVSIKPNYKIWFND